MDDEREDWKEMDGIGGEEFSGVGEQMEEKEGRREEERERWELEIFRSSSKGIDMVCEPLVTAISYGRAMGGPWEGREGRRTCPVW